MRIWEESMMIIHFLSSFLFSHSLYQAGMSWRDCCESGCLCCPRWVGFECRGRHSHFIFRQIMWLALWQKIFSLETCGTGVSKKLYFILFYLFIYLFILSRFLFPLDWFFGLVLGDWFLKALCFELIFVSSVTLLKSSAAKKLKLEVWFALLPLGIVIFSCPSFASGTYSFQMFVRVWILYLEHSILYLAMVSFTWVWHCVLTL